MRQTSLLNAVVLGFFVLLFSSIYRRRPSERLKLWIAAWSAAVLHFLVLVFEPSSGRFDGVFAALSIGSLMACGICFILSLPMVDGPKRRRIVAASLAGPGLLLGAFAASKVHPVSVFLLIALLAQGLGLVLLWRYNRERLSLSIPGTVFILACSEWSSVELVARNGSAAISVVLMELFGIYALLFAHDFRRRSTGVGTTVAGLIAWALVFPVGMLMARFWPNVAVDPELWNVPKIVVAFGMLVTLFEEELISSEREKAQYQKLFDVNPLPMWIFDKESTRLLEANAAAQREFGWKREDLADLTISNLAAEEQNSPVGLVELNWRLAEDATPDPAKTAPGQENSVSAPSMRFLTKEGEELIVEVTMQRTGFQDREARLLVAKDITAETHEHEQLLHQANHDPLTGLPNRLLLQDRMETALAGATRHARKAAIVCIDLDRFKTINDTWGHSAGDSCLREIARRLQRRLRTVDTAARIGGEEFMVILSDVGNVEDAERVVDDLLFTLSAPHSYEGEKIRLSASIGVALFPDDAQTTAELWNMADAAMYRAKESGGNRHRFFSQVQ